MKRYVASDRLFKRFLVPARLSKPSREIARRSPTCLLAPSPVAPAKSSEFGIWPQLSVSDGTHRALPCTMSRLFVNADEQWVWVMRKGVLQRCPVLERMQWHYSVVIYGADHKREIRVITDIEPTVCGEQEGGRKYAVSWDVV